MTEVRLKQYFATVKVRLAEEAMLQHSPSSAVVIGAELSEQVHDYVKQRSLGYYPALAFFEMENTEGRGWIDPDLLETTESMSWLLCRLVRSEVQNRLKQVFSNVKFQAIQTMAYNMPAVRYNANNALHELALHYTPLSVKLNLELSMISKQPLSEGIEDFVANTLNRLLGDSFELVEVSSVVKIESSLT